MTGTEAISTIFVPYGQGRGRGLDATELGVHGVELDRLVALGLPVVPGLTVPVSHATSLARPEVAQAAIDLLQQVAGRGFGDPAHPVLIRLLASTPVGGAGFPPTCRAWASPPRRRRPWTRWSAPGKRSTTCSPRPSATSANTARASPATTSPTPSTT